MLRDYDFPTYKLTFSGAPLLRSPNLEFHTTKSELIVIYRGPSNSDFDDLLTTDTFKVNIFDRLSRYKTEHSACP